MNKQLWITSALFTLVLAEMGGAARAQYPYIPPATNPYQKPIISPFVNLGRTGSPAINYFGIVRPQQQLFNGLSQVQKQVGTSQANNGGTQQDMNGPVSTGHPIYFLNYHTYFLNYGSPTATSRSSTTGTSGGQGSSASANGAQVGRAAPLGSGRVTGRSNAIPH